MRPSGRRAQRGSAADVFRRIYWDTALAASDPVFRTLRDIAGIERVFYGTNFPYLRRYLAVRSKQQILQSPELDASEKCAILGGNASRLFPRQLHLGYLSNRVVWLDTHCQIPVCFAHTSVNLPRFTNDFPFSMPFSRYVPVTKITSPYLFAVIPSLKI